jgi:type I restriction enzyme, S subunit
MKPFNHSVKNLISQPHFNMSEVKNIPRLRFSEFDSNWEQEKIKNITTVKAGGTPSTAKKKFWGGKILWMNSGELNLKRVYDVENRITDLGLKNSSTRLIPEKCILIGLAGQGKTRGTAAVNYISLCTNQSIAAIYPNHTFNTEFLYQNIDNRYDELRRLSTGDGGRGGLNLSIIGGIKVPIPSLPEQQKIADFLTAVDKRIELLEKKKTLLETYKKGVMQQIFSQELRFKDEDGNDFPDWEEKRLGELCEIKAGGDVGKLNFSKTKTEIHKFPVYANALSNKGLYGYSDKPKINSDSVTVTGRGDVGYALSRKEKFSPVVRLLTLIPYFPMSVYFLKTAINKINIYVESTGVPQLTAPQLSAYKVSLPKLEEQKKIANFLTSLDSKIELVNTQIENTKAFKKGLLQQMFI